MAPNLRYRCGSRVSDDAPPRRLRTTHSRRAILRGDLREGTRLQQNALAKQLQVSTTPVRETLGRLAGDGLVRIDPHRGVLVRGLDDDELEEIYQLRQILEPIATRKAERITDKELDEAERYWQLMEDHSGCGSSQLF